MEKWSIFYVIGNMFLSDFRRRRRRKIGFLAPQAPEIRFWGWFLDRFSQGKCIKISWKILCFEAEFQDFSIVEAGFHGFIVSPEDFCDYSLDFDEF